MIAHPASTDGRPRLGLVRLLAFALTVALVALLGFVRGAQAAPLDDGPLVPLLSAPDAEVEELDDGEEDGEEEEGEDELEEAWAACEELEGDSQREACEEEVEEREAREALEECGLSETASTATADPASGTLHIVVRYRAYSPGRVSVGYSLRGGRGSLNLGRKTERFARRGVFHDTARLGRAQMAKVLAAGQFTIELEAVGAPERCEGLFDERVGVKRSDRSRRGKAS